MRDDVELTDGTLLIRPYQTGDIMAVHEAVRESVAELLPWSWWCRADYSIEDTRTWLESRPEAWAKEVEYDLAITDAKEGLFLGGCGLNHINRTNKYANLGYWVRSTRTGQGVATAATLLVAEFGFSELKLNRMEIAAAIGNKASQRVAEKAGAHREGILRNRIAVRDQIYDAVMFSLIAADLGKATNAQT